MFDKKYIFETKQTRSKRKIINLFISLFLFSGLYLGMAYYILKISELENLRTEEAFYHKSPDLFAIFTGDSGRISFGIKNAEKYRVPYIFITGVNSANSLKTILDKSETEAPPKYKIEMNNIELDYLARNTVENVISIFIYLNKNRGSFKNVVIVSSDYHIFRIKMILQMMKFSKIEDINFYYLGNERSFDNIRKYKILLKEVYKSIKALAFLLLWETEYQDFYKNPVHVSNNYLNSRYL